MLATINGTTPLLTTVTNTSQQLTLVNGTTVPVRRYLVTSTKACWIKLGSNPTAAAQTAANTYLPANVPVVVMAQGGFEKLAVIRDSEDGHLTATPIV